MGQDSAENKDRKFGWYGMTKTCYWCGEEMPDERMSFCAEETANCARNFSNAIINAGLYLASSDGEKMELHGNVVTADIKPNVVVGKQWDIRGAYLSIILGLKKSG